MSKKSVTKRDHLVVAARNLTEGVEYVKRELGVDIPVGGSHDSMGTHNHVMRLGDEMFLEVIAVDPEGKEPSQPRWFGLDDPIVQKVLRDGPTFLTWVVNVRPDIHQLLAACAGMFGMPEKITRGDLTWHFGLPEDGRLLAGGFLPYVIQWSDDQSPTMHMADLKCHLKELSIYHPKVDWLRTALDKIGATQLVSLHSLPPTESAYLEAIIDTPNGSRALRSFGFNKPAH